MKTNYFKHKLFPVDGTSICESLQTSINSMISNGNNTATIDGEYYVIQHVAHDVYSFVKTNSKDVFRKLDVTNNTCVDFSQILRANEKIAFASFFILKGELIGFCNSLYSPRIKKLAEIYDRVMLQRNNNHNINFEPITNDITEQDVLSYAHVGKITMKMEKSPNILSGLSTFFSTNVNYDDVDSFEIKIIPKRAKDIKDTFSGLMQQIPREVTSIAVTAKESIGDIASDLNVIMSNTVFDITRDSSTTDISDQMEDNYRNNSTLRSLGY